MKYNNMYCKENIVTLLALVLILVISGCAGIRQNDIPAPSHFFGISRDMNRPEFWISRHTHPDDLIMNRQAIHAFNRHEVDGHPHVIHSLWGYGDAGKNAHQIRVVNGVRVTSLSLGAGSVRGSLLDRLKTMPSIAMP